MRIDTVKARTKLPRIMQAAVALFAERGVEGTTIREIAKGAGVAPGALYRHYKTKDDLAHAIFRENVEELAALLFSTLRPNRPLARNLEALVGTLFEEYERDPLLARFVLFAQFRETPRLPPGFRYPSDAFAEALRIACERGEVEAKEIPLLTAMTFGAAVRATVFRALGVLPDLRTLTKEVARRCARMTR